jgi:hypothetical protein
MNAFVVSYAERLVEGFKNSATFTGFVAKINKEDSTINLMMSNNEALTIPIKVKSVDKIKLHSPLTMECHVFGGRDKNGKAYTEVRAFRIERPSTFALPPIDVWYGIQASASVEEAKAILAKNKVTEQTDSSDDVGTISPTLSNRETEFRPFLSNGKLRGRLKSETDENNVVKNESIEEANLRIVSEMVEATGFKPNTNNGGNNNMVRLVGIVDSMVVVPQTQHRKAHGIIFVRQHADASKSIPLWVVGEGFKNHLKSLCVGMPISVLGQARYKVYPDDKGDLTDGGLHVRCWKFYNVELKKDMPFTPSWWLGMKDRIVADKKAKMSALEAAGLVKQKLQTKSPAESSTPPSIIQVPEKHPQVKFDDE